MKTGIVRIVVGLGFLTATLAHAQDTNIDWSAASDLQVELQAIEQVPPMPADDVTNGTAFWSAQHAPGSAEPWPPLPGNIFGMSAWDLGDGTYLLDDLGYRYHAHRRHKISSQNLSGSGEGMTMADDDDGPVLPGDDDDTNSTDDSFPALSGVTPINTNLLWLQMTNVADGMAYVNLNNPTDYVYAIWSTTNLSTPFTNWQVETEVFPSNTNCMPFTVQTQDRQDLFLQAEDWTGITSNGNTTPDWWFWEYYGTTDLSDTNLDSIGQQLVVDYQNNVDPNIIFFGLQFPEEVQSNVVNGTVTIYGGMPSYVAVLINDTNQADAIWEPYTSTNLTLNLDWGDGFYMVSVGMRGMSPNATTIWAGTRIQVFHPPAFSLAIANPATATVSQPMIQLQGWANQTLGALTFDVSNALGVVTNQQGYWQASFYDTNAQALTTNTFQCYDVPLTNGLNSITLYATDTSGDTITTNFDFTLDYSSDTNPPALNILWPQNGACISGNSFTLQAQMDDDTAIVTASIDGQTNVGLVERSGRVWVNNLPMATGTNILTVRATDAAGNSVTTNLCLVQSPVSVTMNPLSGDQLNQSSVDVTGTLSDTNETYDLFVNGVEAYYLDDEGDWEADNVPASPTGVATFDVEIYTGDPVNAGSQNYSQIQPPVIGLTAYTSSYYNNTTHPWGCDDGLQAMSEANGDSTGWIYPTGGNNSTFVLGLNGDCEPDNSSGGYSLPGGLNGITPTWEINSYGGSGYTPPYWIAPGPPWWTEWSYVNAFANYGTYSSSANAHVGIIAGGLAVPGQKSLYLVQAQVYDEDTSDQIPGNEFQFMNQMPETSVMDVTNEDSSVTSEGLVSAPAGENVEVTPQTPGDISFSGMTVSHVTLQIIDANTGNNLTDQTNTVIVGQQMNLMCQLSVTNLPFTNLVLTNFSWAVPGDAISNYVVAADASSAYVVTNFPATNSTVVFYWVDGTSNRIVQVSATVNGTIITGQATFNIYRPSVTFTDEPPSWATNTTVDGVYALSLGNGSFGDMEYEVDILSQYTGRADFTQLINRDAANGDTTDSTGGQYWLDNYEFYLVQSDDPNVPRIVETNKINRILQFDDGPYFQLEHSLIGGDTTSIVDYFKDYIMFRPNKGNVNNNIYVPLGKLTWSWSAATTYSSGIWPMPTFSIIRPNSPDGGYEFPQWSQTYH